MGDWEDEFDSFKPLINYVWISGIDIIDISYIFLDLMLGVDPLNRPLQPKYIDRIPRIQRKGVEVPALNDFIFSDGFHLETNMLKTKQLTIPFVMTGVQATRQYVMSLITYEDLYDYVQIINDIIENEKELEIWNLENTKSQNYERIYVSEDYLKSNNIDQDLLNDLINLKQIYKKFVSLIYIIKYFRTKIKYLIMYFELLKTTS